MLTYHFLSIAIALTLSLTSMFPLFSLIHADHHGFSVELLHRDSPISPLYNPLERPSKRVANALQRSINHANQIFKATSFPSNWPESTITPDTGEYLMKILIGTHPVEILGIADTGSDLSWIQCIPCSTIVSSRKHHSLIPKTPKLTRNNLVTQASVKLLKELHAPLIMKKLVITKLPMGIDPTTMELLPQTVTFGSTTGQPFRLPHTIFGCGHNNSGLFGEAASGMIGLARGSASLISQMGSTIDGKLSFCLVHAISTPNATTASKMNVGSRAVVSGFRVVSTPLLTDVTCVEDSSSFAVLALLPKSSPCMGSNEPNFQGKDGVILFFNVTDPVPLAIWSVRKAKGGGLAFLKGNSPSFQQKSILGRNSPQAWLVYINADHEYILFDPYDNDAHELSLTKGKGRVAAVDETAQFGYASIYGELPQFEMKRNHTMLAPNAPSQRPWETIFSGSSHNLLPLPKLCLEFMESLLERTTTVE